jgi:hypothetical protein
MSTARSSFRRVRAPARALACAAAVIALASGVDSAAQEDPFDPPPDGIAPPLPSAADEPPRLPDALREEFFIRLDALDDDSWAVRQRASEWFCRSDVPREAIEETLDAAPLTHEQRHRLIGALYTRILSARPGAIGIRMANPAPATIGVRVDGIFSGMPAEHVLKRNDRVTHVNDRAVYSTDMFQEAVSDLEPGEVVRLTIQRPREPAAPPGDGVPPDLATEEELETMVVEIPVVDAAPLGAAHLEGVMADRQRRASLLIAIRAPQPVMLRVPAPESAADADPRVALLKSQLEAIRERGLGVTQELLQSWRATKLELQREVNEPNLSAAERIARRSVYERYAELLSPTGL